MVRYWLLGVLMLVAAMVVVPRAASSQTVLPRAGQSFSFGIIEGPYSNSDSTSSFQQTSLILTVVSVYSGCGIITSPSGYTKDFSFAPGAATIINLPINLIQKADLGKTNKGLLVHTTAPVNLVLHDYVPYAGDATQILPDNALDTSYVTFGWGIWDDIGEDNLTEFLVTAEFDSTFVTITPSVRTLLGQADSVPFIVMLNRGECYIDKADTSDHPIDPSLSGSIIHSTKPVSVISGLTCAYVPVGVEACNELMDELVGKEWWGSHFFVQPLDIHDSGGEVVLTSDRDFIAKINNVTDTSFHHRLETTFSGPSEIHTLDSLNHPILVEAHQLTQSYSYGRGSGDPSLVSVLDTFYYSDTAIWNTPSFDFPTQLIPIIFPTADFTRATLDGKLFSQLGISSSVINGSSYSAINPPVTPGLHQIVSPDPVFAISAGFFGADAYSFVAGTAGAKQPSDSSGHALILQADSASTCSEFDVTASLGTPFLSSEGVITFTISITYDNTTLHLISVVPDSVLLNASYTVDTSKPGTVTITVLGTPLITGSNLFQLVFEGWKSTVATTVSLNSGATTICADDSEDISSLPVTFAVHPSIDTFPGQFLLSNSKAILCEPLNIALSTDTIVVPSDGLVISKIEVLFNPATEQFQEVTLGRLLANKPYTQKTLAPGDIQLLFAPPSMVSGASSVLLFQFIPQLPSASDTVRVRIYYLECGDTLSRDLAIAFPITYNNALFAPLALSFDSTVICIPHDTVIVFGDSSCAPLTLTNVSITGTDWTLLNGNGKPFPVPNTIQSYSSLTLLLQFHPTAIAEEQDTVSLTYTYSDSTYTRTILLSGAGKPPGTLEYSSALDFGNTSLCLPVDSQITFNNQTCDTAIVDSVRVTPPFVLLGKLPLVVKSGLTAGLKMQYAPHTIANDTGQAIVMLTINGAPVTDTLTLSGAGSSSGTMQFSRTLNFGGATLCTLLDTQITFSNKTCDTATIDSIFVEPPFTLLDHLPVSIAGQSSIKLNMRFAPNSFATDTGYAIVMLTVNGSPVTDTLTFTGTGVPSGAMLYSHALNFGGATVCSHVDSEITFTNRTCDSAFIDSISVTAPFMVIDQLPLEVGAKATAGLHVQYSPNSNSNDTGRAIISLTVNGIPVTDTVSLVGIGTGRGEANLLSTAQNDSVVFTRTECDPPDTVQFYLYNSGCDSLIFTSGFNVVADSAGAWSEIFNPTPSLMAGDSVLVALVTHDTLPGVYSGLFQTSYLDSNRVLSPFTIWIAETIGKSPRTMAIDTTPINLGTIQPCQSLDVAIPYTNTSCKSLNVNIIGWNLSSWSSGFNVTGTGNTPPYPIMSGSSDSLHVSFDGSQFGTIYDTVIVTMGTDQDSVRRIPVQVFVPAVDSVNFILSMQAQLSSGELFAASILPDRAVVGKGLTSVSGVLSWNTNDFDFDSLSAPNNLTLVHDNPYFAKENTRVAFSVSNASGIMLEPANPIAQLWLRADLTDTINYRVTLDSVLLNGSDPSYSQCTLAASGNAVTAGLSLACGDSLLIEGMSGSGLIFMEDPQPNPATDQITVHFRNNLEHQISYELIDALGKTRLSGATGEDALTLDVSPLAEGVYFLRAFAAGGASVSREIMVLR